MSSYKNVVFILSLIRSAVFTFFCISLYEMVDSEYDTDNYKYLKITIRAIIKNPKMLIIVLDHLETKKMQTFKHAVKNLPVLIKYVPDQYLTRKLFDKAVVENGGTLMFVLDRYKCVTKLLIIILMH